MKEKLTVLLIYFFAVNCYSQIWSPIGAKWHHTFFSNYSSYITTTYEKDTVVNGESCKLLKQTSNDITPYDTIFTKEMDSVVYVYNEQTHIFDTLFNFKSTIGSSWKIPGFGFSGCGTDGKIVVADKGYRNINGFDLLWLKVNVLFDPLNNNNLWDYSDTIFQRFGTNEMYFMPFSFCENNLEMESIINFRCYQDYSFSNLNETNNSCDYIPENSINNIYEIKYSVYIDSKYLKIVSADKIYDKNIEIKLMDISGNVFLNNIKLCIEEEPINIEHLPKGTYIITINNLYNKLIII